MSNDLYVELGGESRQDVDTLVDGRYQHLSIDPYTRICLLAGTAARNNGIKDYAVSGDRRKGGGYKSLVHDPGKPQNTPYAQNLISLEKARMDALGLWKPTAPDLTTLPIGSWFLQFTFTLAKPWMSKDDTPFYVADSINPVRKDKVFKVPMMAASSWKGVLRWTMMHTQLALKKTDLDSEAFAQERLAQTLLFGDEKGEEPGQNRDMAKFLDELKPEARPIYAQLLKAYFYVDPDAPLPHHTGRLMFYPTFFNLIDVEVINPHSRKTKAGTHPIYLECVPASAEGEGTFTLLYVPFDLIGKPETEVRTQVAEDVQRLAQGLRAMFRTYGFGAKTSSGFGLAEEALTDATLILNVPDKPKSASKPTEPHLPSEVKAFRQDFPNEDFQLKPKAWRRQHGATSSEREAYTQARKVHRRYTKQLAAYEQTLAAWQAQAEVPAPPLTQRTFATFEDLVKVTQKLSIAQQGGIE